jgi:hypothetical protein
MVIMRYKERKSSKIVREIQIQLSREYVRSYEDERRWWTTPKPAMGWRGLPWAKEERLEQPLDGLGGCHSLVLVWAFPRVRHCIRATLRSWTLTPPDTDHHELR